MSIFPTKILLATDGSRSAVHAGEVAAGIAGATGSELHVAHVMLAPVLYPNLEAPVMAGDRIYEEEKIEAQNLLDEQVKRIQETGTAVAGSYLREGAPDAEIVALAEDIDVGLIVIGSRGLGGIRRALLGSVSDSVVHHAHCPVLVVRPGEEAR